MIEACHKTHNVPHFENKNNEIKWIWETHFHNAFIDLHNSYMSEGVEHRPFAVLCNHCENPPCVRACPTKATFKRESDGIVLMDFHRCIGCRFCMVACPYGARSFNFRNPREGLDADQITPNFARRMRGVVEKCNFCCEKAEQPGQAWVPECVRASEDALIFGDIRDGHNVPVRLQKEEVAEDVFGASGRIDHILERMSGEERGVFVYLRAGSVGVLAGLAGGRSATGSRTGALGGGISSATSSRSSGTILAG